MEILLNQFRKNPGNIGNLHTLLEQFLNKEDDQQTKLQIGNQLLQVLQKLSQKLDQNKHAATLKHIFSILPQFMEIFLHCYEQYKDERWADIIANLVINFKHNAQQMCAVFVNLLVKGEISHPENYTNGDFLFQILTSISEEQIINNNAEILKYLLELSHYSELTFLNGCQNGFKQRFQQLLICCFDFIDEISIQKQTNIYNKLGEKVFSKLAAPLALSQFLLSKITGINVHPALQIEVLAALFILVGKHGLELDKFYDNLQRIISQKRLVNVSLFRLKNSKRFLKLVEAAMRSSKVPFKNILSLSRLLFQIISKQRSQLTFWFLSFLVNLVKKHRQLQSHLVQMAQVQALKYHYCQKVRSLMKQVSKNMNKSQYLDISDFSSISCKKLCNMKLQQIIQKVGNTNHDIEFIIPRAIDYL